MSQNDQVAIIFNMSLDMRNRKYNTPFCHDKKKNNNVFDSNTQISILSLFASCQSFIVDFNYG